MHSTNMFFWKRCSEKYPLYFKNPSHVIEFGSGYINGSIRDVFECSKYIGIDWRAGKNVDLVSLAHEVSFGSETFDMVASASMLEHDPHWIKSIAKMIDVLKKDGLMALSWGAALNGVHGFREAPDGKFHALKAGYVIDLLEAFGMYIHEFEYERKILLEKEPEYAGRTGLGGTPLGLGEVVLVAFKDKKYAVGIQSIMDLLDVDKS